MIVTLHDRGTGFSDQLLWFCPGVFCIGKLLSDWAVYFTGNNQLNFDIIPFTKMNDGLFLTSRISQ
jgi:hypothetical protein